MILKYIDYCLADTRKKLKTVAFLKKKKKKKITFRQTHIPPTTLVDKTSNYYKNV